MAAVLGKSRTPRAASLSNPPDLALEVITRLTRDITIKIRINLQLKL